MTVLLLLGLACASPQAMPDVTCGTDGLRDEDGACVPLACGTGRWGVEAPDDGAIYVDASATGTPDGSREHPFPDLPAAIAAARSTTSHDVRLAAGDRYTMPELGNDDAGLRLRGRCEALVGVDELALRTTREVPAAVSVEDLTLGRMVNLGGSITAEHVTLDLSRSDVAASHALWLYASSGRVNLLQSTLLGSAWVTGGHLNVQESTVRGTEEYMLPAIAADQQATVTIRDSVIEGRRAEGAPAPAIEARTGARVTVANSSLISGILSDGLDQETDGIGPEESRAVVTVTDSSLTGLAYDELNPYFTRVGLSASSGGIVRASACVLEGFDQGVSASGAPSDARSEVELDAVTIEGDVAAMATNQIMGLYVRDAARVTANLLDIRATNFGVYASGSGASADLTDVTVTELYDPFYGDHAMAAAAVNGATVDLRSGTLEGMVHAADAGSWVDVQRSRIERVRRPPSRTCGLGAVVTSDALLELADTTVADIAGPGLAAFSSGELRCTGCSVERTSFAGAISGGGKLVLEGSKIDEVTVDPELGGGLGVYAGTLFTDSGRWFTSDVRIDGTTIAPQAISATWWSGAGAYQVRSSVLHGSAGTTLRDGLQVHGNAVYAGSAVQAWDGVRGLLVADTRLTGSSTASVMLDGASARFQDNVWRNNALDVLRFHCDPADAPTRFEAGMTYVECPSFDPLVLPLEFRPEIPDIVIRQ